eukprot:123908-Hanusia_phi.AAC.1
MLRQYPWHCKPVRMDTLRGGGRDREPTMCDFEDVDGLGGDVCMCGDPSCRRWLKHPRSKEEFRMKRYNDIATDHLERIVKGESLGISDLPEDMREDMLHEMQQGVLKELCEPVTPWWMIAPFGNISRADGEKRDLSLSKRVEETIASLSFNGQTCGRYSWAQDRKKVCFYMFLDEEVQSKQVQVKIGLHTLQISIAKVPVVSIRLSHPVRCSEDVVGDCWEFSSHMGRKILKVTMYKSLLGIPDDAIERAEGVWWRSLSSSEARIPPSTVFDTTATIEDVMLRTQKPFYAPQVVSVKLDHERGVELGRGQRVIDLCSDRQLNGRMTEDPVGASSMLQAASYSLNVLHDRSFTCYAQVINMASIEVNMRLPGTMQQRNLFMILILEDVEAILSSHDAPFHALSGCCQVLEQAEEILWARAEEAKKMLITSKGEVGEDEEDDEDEDESDSSLGAGLEDRMVRVDDPDKNKRMLARRSNRRQDRELGAKADDLFGAADKVKDILSCLWIANMSHRTEVSHELRKFSPT